MRRSVFLFWCSNIFKVQDIIQKKIKIKIYIPHKPVTGAKSCTWARTLIYQIFFQNCFNFNLGFLCIGSFSIFFSLIICHEVFIYGNWEPCKLIMLIYAHIYPVCCSSFFVNFKICELVRWMPTIGAEEFLVVCKRNKKKIEIKNN